MHHQPDTDIVDDDLISLTEVEAWDTDALKEYCRRRGFKCSGTKRELCSRVYTLYNAKVPEVPGVREQEASKKRDYASLFKIGGPAPDPHRLRTWESEETGMKKRPPISYFEIHKFIAKRGHSLSDSALTSYKTGKAYSYFFNDWLRGVYYHQINKDNVACFLKADCTPSNRISDIPHSVWIKVDKKNGNIFSAYCSCVAGFSQTCNHVAALLFKVESAFRLDISNPSCTSKECGWSAPSSRQRVFMKLEDMFISKPTHKKGKRQPVQTAIASQTTEILEIPREDHRSKTFMVELKELLPTALTFLPGQIRNTQIPNEPDVVELDINENDPHLELCEKVDIINIGKECLSVSDLLHRIALSPEDISAVERQTTSQSKSVIWKTARKGRITASNFYRVFTKVETLKKCPTTSTTALVNSLINPPSLSHLPQISKGIEQESHGVANIIKLLTDSAHVNVQVRECGLFIDSNQQFIGASPDGIISCDCCDDMLLEVKCPSKDIAQLNYLDDKGQLKHKSAYYGQVQGQMMVTGIKKCIFYIHHDQCPTYQEIFYDEDFCTHLKTNICIFYEHHMAPNILQLSRKRHCAAH